MLELLMELTQIGGVLLINAVILLFLIALIAIIVCCGITLIISLGSVLLATVLFIIILSYLTGNPAPLQVCLNR